MIVSLNRSSRPNGMGGLKTMKNCFSFGFVVMAVGCLLIAPACRQQPQTRQYEEKGAAAAPAQNQPQGQLRYETWRWEKPLQWREEKGVQLRLVTFLITGREGSGECALITLPGDGGGVKANVQRWLDQLHLPLFSPPELEDFLTRQKKMQTKNGLPVTIIDFTTLSGPQNRMEQSMLVAVIQAESQTLFVKIIGGKALLGKNREVFYKFCQSLSLGA
jgi:hypothetical protein